MTRLDQLSQRPLDHLAVAGEPEAIALRDGLGDVDYALFDRMTGCLAGWLLDQGLELGDRVASWLAKGRIACLLPLACARAGLVHVPVNPVLKARQAGYILDDSGAKLLVSSVERIESLWRHDVMFTGGLWPETAVLEALDDRADPLPPSGHGGDTLAAILYTSGSTGQPKGVMLSHLNMMLGAISVASYLRLAADDRTLCLLPFSFDYGQNQLFSTWAAGGMAVPFDYLMPRDVVKAIGRHGITTLAGVPPLWVQLDEIAWPPEAIVPIRRLTNSGGKLAVPLVRRMRARFPTAQLFLMYGLTEAFRSTYLDPELVDCHPDSIGKAIPYAEIRILRPDGRECAPDEPGELVHGGPLVAQGYWRDAVRSAERFRPAPSCMAAGGMAVWSGDMVTRGTDGLLRFMGRSDEMIKVSGNRLSPTEIEEAAMASGLVAEAMACGIEDARLGQAVILVARPKSLPDEAGLRAWFRREMPHYMMPQKILWREIFPRNSNGKIDRVKIKSEIGI